MLKNIEAIRITENTDDFLQIDKSGMINLVEKFPEMAKDVPDIAENIEDKHFRGINKIVFAGMGGSAIGGDIASSILSDISDIPVFVIRNYSLPKFADAKTLVIAISYSGNTEETLSIFAHAQKIGSKIILISSGGELGKKSKNDNIPFLKVMGGLPPRAALPVLLFTLLKLIHKLGIVSGLDRQITEAISILESKRKIYGISSDFENNDAKKLSRELLNKIPIILGSSGGSDAACLRWKTQFNENSKATAICNNFPELNHNELVNLARLKNGAHPFSLIILRDKYENDRIRLRIEITKRLLSDSFDKIYEYYSEGESKLARILSLIYLGDYVSTYLAVLKGIDPTPVDSIEKLKKDLLN